MYKGCLRPALENGDEDPRLTDQVSETRVFQALNWEKRGPSIALDQYRNAPEWPPKWMCPVGARWTENTLTEALPVSPNAPRLGAGEFHPSSFVEKNSKTKRLSYSGKLESFSIFWEARWYEADCEKYNPSKSNSDQQKTRPRSSDSCLMCLPFYCWWNERLLVSLSEELFWFSQR